MCDKFKEAEGKPPEKPVRVDTVSWWTTAKLTFLCGYVNRESICGGSDACSPFKISKCGGKIFDKRTERTLVANNAYPWLIGLWDTYGTQQIIMHGVVVHPRILLLATDSIHFESYPDFTVRGGGETSLKALESIAYGHWYTVKVCVGFKHPGWDSATGQKNFYLSPLEEPGINETIHPIPFAKPGQPMGEDCRVISWTKVHERGEIWGKSDVLTEARIKPLPAEECASFGYPSGVLCTEPVLCGRGEHGAPLICTYNGVDMLYGLANTYYTNMDEPGGVCLGHSMFSMYPYYSEEFFQKYLSKVEC